MKKIAYLILAHSDPKHLQTLIKSINYKCDFYIHLDKKANFEDFSFIQSKNNIFFSKKRYDIAWGGFNMVNATKELIRLALKSNNIYSHLILLSGMDYPIK